MQRAQQNAIIKDLKKKMVLLAGPRQAGKTTLAKTIAKEFKSPLYLNYDSSADRKIILEESWLPSTDLLIFDEIHKMPNWKNYLKGVFDTKTEEQSILVTGSARLDIFHEVGDSLAGRYFLHRLLPLSPSECHQMHTGYTLDRFLERGGFPEPFLAEDNIEADRWRKQYTDSLLREDVLNFENIQHVRTIRLIFEILRDRVGSPLSYLSIAEDVQISPNTVKKYIQILEALYIIFRITPYSNNIARSLLKEPKLYFFDVGLVKSTAGARFENLVALCLLKTLYAKTDALGRSYELKYLQTKERHEVDFAIVHEDQIESIVEVKLSDSTLAPGIKYFHRKYDLSALQIVKELKKECLDSGITVMDAKKYLQGLYL